MGWGGRRGGVAVLCVMGKTLQVDSEADEPAGGRCVVGGIYKTSSHIDRMAGAAAPFKTSKHTARPHMKMPIGWCVWENSDTGNTYAEWIRWGGVV